MQLYETKDLTTASVLIYFNSTIVSIRKEGKSCYFSFEHNPRLSQILQGKLLGQLLVEPVHYHDIEKETRSKAFQFTNSRV